MGLYVALPGASELAFDPRRTRVRASFLPRLEQKARITPSAHAPDVASTKGVDAPAPSVVLVVVQHHGEPPPMRRLRLLRGRRYMPSVRVPAHAPDQAGSIGHCSRFVGLRHDLDGLLRRGSRTPKRR